MDSIPVPLWSIGVILIVVGPFAVQRLVDLWTKPVEKRTDDALSAMTAGSPRREPTDVREPEEGNDEQSDNDDSVTQHDSARH